MILRGVFAVPEYPDGDRFTAGCLQGLATAPPGLVYHFRGDGPGVPSPGAMVGEELRREMSNVGVVVTLRLTLSPARNAMYALQVDAGRLWAALGGVALTRREDGAVSALADGFVFLTTCPTGNYAPLEVVEEDGES